MFFLSVDCFLSFAQIFGPVCLFFIVYAFMSWPINHFQVQNHDAFPLCFLQRVLQFWVLYLTFYFFALFFVCSIRQRSNFIHLHVNIQFSQHYLSKRLSFLCCVFLAIVEDELTTFFIGLFLGSLLSISLYICLFASIIQF